MDTSPEIGELAKAIAAAQAKMKPAVKDATNPHFKSKYADLASIWDACREALGTNGLAVLQGVTCQGADVTVETRLIHASGQWLSTALTIAAANAGAQSIGSAVTYGRRYGLAAMLGISAEEDDDGNAAGTPTARPSAPRPASAAPALAQADGPVLCPPCPSCGGAMWDNRATKTNPKSPDAKCKDKDCQGKIWSIEGHLRNREEPAQPPTSPTTAQAPKSQPGATSEAPDALDVARRSVRTAAHKDGLVFELDVAAFIEKRWNKPFSQLVLAELRELRDAIKGRAVPKVATREPGDDDLGFDPNVGTENL